MLQYFLQHYDQLLFLDDDVLLSPNAPDLFSRTPCGSLGAVYEGYHKPGWHAMHGRSYCELYGLASSQPQGASAKKPARYGAAQATVSPSPCRKSITSKRWQGIGSPLFLDESGACTVSTPRARAARSQTPSLFE